MWGLVLPQSFPARTVDIMRGYWQQPLMWNLGQRLGYYTPITKHQRNKHNLLSDSIAEEGFLMVEGLLQFLSSWSCPSTTLYECIEDLTIKLADEGIWQKEDITFTRAWLRDLKAIGYVPPVLKS